MGVLTRTVGDDTFDGDAVLSGDVTKLGDGDETLGVGCSLVLAPFSALRAGFLFKSGSLAGTSWYVPPAGCSYCDESGRRTRLG